MIGFIFRLTLRQLVFRKSTLLLIGLAALPVLLAVVFRLGDSTRDPDEWTARVLMVSLVLTVVLPLTALLWGTSVLGDELEDGTASYLLTKPIARWQILLPKIAAAFALTAALCVPATLIAGSIALDGTTGIVTGFAVGVLAASLAYVTLFVMLSLITTRALIAGLIYVFLWEGAITGIFQGLRYLAVRHYAMGIAESIADTPPTVFDAYVSGTTAIILLVIVTAAAAVFANRYLERVQVRDTT